MALRPEQASFMTFIHRGWCVPDVQFFVDASHMVIDRGVLDVEFIGNP